MTTLAGPTDGTIIEVYPCSGETGSAVDDSLVETADRRSAHRDGWRHIIDSTLIEWGRDPSQLEDDGVTAPTRAVVNRANELARELRDGGVPPPNRAVTNGDGGIVFEWWKGSVFEQIEIADDGSITVTRIVDAQVVLTTRLV